MHETVAQSLEVISIAWVKYINAKAQAGELAATVSSFNFPSLKPTKCGYANLHSP